MNTLITFTKTNIWKILTVIFFLLFLTRGCTHKKITAFEKRNIESNESLMLKIDSLEKKINRVATSKQVRDEMEIAMFNFLIYEDDLDKGRTNLSDIKNKIESND